MFVKLCVRTLGEDSAFQHPAHNRPVRRASGHLAETGFAEGVSQASVIENVRVTRLRFTRVAFEDPGAMAGGKVGRLFEETCRQSFAPIGTGHKETGYRPNRLLINGLEDSRFRETWVIGPGSKRAPTDRLVTCIGEKARGRAGLNQLAESTFVDRALLFHLLSVAQPPKHAPATTTTAAITKQGSQMGPPGRG